MSKYTAQDFANARFAEHEVEGDRAARSFTNDLNSPWTCLCGTRMSDNEMAVNGGWVPVPTKPTITESEWVTATWDLDATASDGFAMGLEFAGINIIPDPKPTNTDRLEQIMINSGARIDAKGIAKYLNDHGVTAPEEDK